MARGVWLALAVTLAPCAPGAWAAAAVQASEQEACAAKPMAGQTSSLMQRAETTMQSKMSGKLEVSHKASVDLIADEDFSTTHAEALVESLAEKVTLQNYTMTDTEQEALKTIKSMVEKMINSTYNQHGEDQWEVTVARDLIENCTNESKLDQVDSLKQTTETKRGEHEVCRMAQKTIWHSSKDKCIEYDRTRKSGEYKNAPSCMVGTPSHLAADYIATEDASKKEKMESCLEDVNDWFWPIYGNYTTCKGSQDELEEKKTQCNSAQDVFERSFCAYASQLSTECQSQEDCRQNAIGHFNRTVEQVEVTAKARRAEFTAGHRIQCFFRIFNATDAEKKNVLDECKNKTVDTGNLTIVVPSIPDAATCTPEANQPCDAQWENVEYKDKDWYPDAPTTACKPCVVPSPTPAPTQADVWAQVGGTIIGEAKDDMFGESVALSADGTRLAVGAPGNDGVGGIWQCGHARVFQEASGAWTQVGGDLDGEARDDAFGKSVALSVDGTRVAVGSTHNDDGGHDSGHVRVFQEVSGAWIQVGGDIDGTGFQDWSGATIALSADGTRLAHGAAKANDHDGYVRVFQETSGVWTQVGGTINGASGSQELFGVTVCLSADGARLGVGVSHHDGVGQDSGKLQVFQDASGVWTQLGGDLYGDATQDFFGRECRFSADGTTLAVGTISGRYVRVFREASGAWTQVGGDIHGGLAEDRPGWGLALSADGKTLAVGAPMGDSGHVKVFQEASGVWTQVGGVINGESAGDRFGRVVALSSDGTRLAVGAPLNAPVNARTGSVRVFRQGQ